MNQLQSKSLHGLSSRLKPSSELEKRECDDPDAPLSDEVEMYLSMLAEDASGKYPVSSCDSSSGKKGGSECGDGLPPLM